MKLHEAIQQVIIEFGAGLTPSEVANTINDLALYKRKDGKPITSSQISARINEYSSLFERDESNRITLLSYGNVQELLWRCYSLLSAIEKRKNGERRSTQNVLTFTIYLIAYIRLKHWDKMNEQSEGYWENFFDNLLSFANSLEVSEALISQVDSFYNEQETIIEWVAINQKVFTLIGLSDLKKVVFELLTQDKNFDKSIYQSSQNITELYGALANKITFQSIYDPTCGVGSSYFTILDQNLKANGKAIEIDSSISLIGSLISILFYPKRSSIVNDNSLLRKKSDKYDLIAFVPPFNMKIGANEVNSKIKDLPKRSTYHSGEVFILQALELLKDNGKVIVNISESTLNANALSDLRYYLVSNRFIESIISLPKGTLNPATAIKSSILILSKTKKSDIYYLDAENWFLQAGKNTRLKANEIADIWSKKKVIKPYTFNLKYSDLDYKNLSLVYSNPYYSTISLTTKVKDFLRVKRLAKPVNEDSQLPYVSIFNLKHNIKDFKLSSEELKPFDYKNSVDKIHLYKKLNSKAILIAKVGDSLKPTYFIGDQEILVHNNIWCFEIKEGFTERIEDLIRSLFDAEFLKRISTINKGTTVAFRSLNDFLKLPFDIIEFNSTGMQEQVDIAKYASDLFGLFRHDFVQPLSTLSLKYDLLKTFLLTWSNEHNYNLLNSSINRRGTTAKQLLNEIENQLQKIELTLSSTQNLYRGTIKGEVFDLREVIKECFYELQDEEKELIKISILGEVNQSLDRGQLKILFSNLFKNALKHGLENDILGLHFELMEHEEEGYLEIKYFNDGKPFPSNFSLDQFCAPKTSGDNSTGTGHGGFIIRQILSNHNGSIDQNWEEGIPKYYNEADGNLYNVYLRFTLKPIQ